MISSLLYVENDAVIFFHSFCTEPLDVYNTGSFPGINEPNTHFSTFLCIGTYARKKDHKNPATFVRGFVVSPDLQPVQYQLGFSITQFSRF